MPIKNKQSKQVNKSLSKYAKKSPNKYPKKSPNKQIKPNKPIKKRDASKQTNKLANKQTKGPLNKQTKRLVDNIAMRQTDQVHKIQGNKQTKKQIKRQTSELIQVSNDAKNRKDRKDKKNTRNKRNTNTETIHGLRIAIVGKTNVGKSTLFNKLCGKKLAIMDDKPGITRDRKEYVASIGNIHFIAVDTAGWENLDTYEHNLMNGRTHNGREHYDATKSNNKEMKKLMIEQTIIAVNSADFVLFVVDGKYGISSDDIEFADLIRKQGKRAILVVNKSESKINIDTRYIHKFGFGEPVYISAAHSMGFSDLYDAIFVVKKDLRFFDKDTKEDNINANNVNFKNIDANINVDTNVNIDDIKIDNIVTTDSDVDNIKIAIVGRPNAGKSTLFNKIIGYNRSIVYKDAGTTRDSINESVVFENTKITLIDTAGMRRKAKVNDNIEHFSLGQTITAIKRANVVVLLMDAQNAFEKQDMAIANIAINEGKPLILVINKCDIIDNFDIFEEEVDKCLKVYFTDVHNIKLLYISAINGKNINQLLDTIKQTFNLWNVVFSTSELNKWLKNATEAHIPPLANNGKRIRIKYVIQKASKPPTFLLFANIPEDLPNSYKRYLNHSLCKYFELESIPVRIIMNKGANPYVK